jgi:hypothetical protein
MADGRMWSTTDNKRWFEVPAEIGIPDGPFEIRDLLGRRRQVDADALMPFELSGAEATTRVRRHMLDLLSKADAGLESLRSLVPEDRPEGAAGLDVMRKALSGIVTGLRTKEDPPPKAYPVDNLAQKFEGWLRGVAADPKGAEGLVRFTDDLQAMARQLQPPAPVVAVAPAAPPKPKPKPKVKSKKHAAAATPPDQEP